MNNVKSLTDMYFIAALLAYDFEILDIDRSNSDSQRYTFSLNEVKTVYIISNSQPQTQMLKVDELESAFISSKLLLPPTYIQTLKSIKNSIMSTKYGDKHDRK